MLGPKAPHLIPKVSDSVDLGVEVGGKICISNEFPGDVDAACQGATFQESLININQQLIVMRERALIIGI